MADRHDGTVQPASTGKLRTHHKPAFEYRLDRELSLVLLGMALVKTERDRILEAVQPGTLDNSVDELLSDLRGQTRSNIAKWLEARGVQVAGSDAVEMLLQCAVDRQKCLRVLELANWCEFAGGQCTFEEMLERLQKAVECCGS